MSTDKWRKPPLDLEGNEPMELGIDCPREVYLNSNWIAAVDAWDYCDGSLLEEMLRRHPIPFELQPVIADIVSGQRPQNKKAAAKLKIPAGHRMCVAGLYATLKASVIDATLQRKTLHDYHKMADSMGIEVIDYKRQLESSAREFKKEVAELAGISTETLDNLLDELKLKINNYPQI